ncbi:MAG: tetratricopeptide repeat protein [Verrucomicrobiota bacterium]
MAFVWRWVVIWFALFLGVGQIHAASLREQRAFAAAQSAFKTEMWSRAAAEFADFVQKYPESANAPRALLLESQAEYEQGNFTNAIVLLTAGELTAGKLADQYADWMGEAQFAIGNYPAAAKTYLALVNDFTNSPLRVAATVNAAAAYAQLAQWPLVENLLEPTNGIFQQALRSDADSGLSLRGQLLRAQAKFAQKDYPGTAAILESKKQDALPPDLAWPWAYLLSQSKSALGDLPGSLSASTNLLQIARDARNDSWLAASVGFQADLLEKSQLTNDAIAAYQQNLTNTNAPVENQRQAVLKIAELCAAQHQFATAEDTLNSFLMQFPNSPATDVALFALGELHLKDYAAQLSATNLLLAKACLDRFVAVYTNSQYQGNVYLDLGWCNWYAGNYLESAMDLTNALNTLPRSLDQAMAHFKLGDALYQLNDFTNALVNYRIVVDGYMDMPAVVQTLEERALYQSLRVSEAMGDFPSAGSALARILKLYPAGDLADNATLHFGEYVADSGRPDAARTLFRQFIKQFPHSDLLPEVKLAVARTYEQEGDWLAATTNYANWLAEFPHSDLAPQAVYAAALANYQAGNETNALAQFTVFISRFSTNDLAPLAQWWVADYFYRANDFSDFARAETNYENIFQNPAWRSSTNLFYKAQMMAGLSAMARNGYSDATRYFTALISDTNCPADLGVQARFACAAAWMQIPSPDTNNPLGNFSTAITFLRQIVQMNPTNDAAARSWGEIGKCEFQMNNYDEATNDFASVFSPNAPAYKSADVSARSAAQVGYGLVLEKLADLATGIDQTNLLKQALGQYLDVFDTNLGNNLRDGELADPFWVKKAGLLALPLIQSLGIANPDKFIDQMEALLPPMKTSLETIRQNLSQKK